MRIRAGLSVPGSLEEVLMKVTFYGTGAAARVPLFGCACPLCQEARDRGKGRNPASILVDTGESRILVDAGLPDLSYSLAYDEVGAILITHYHVDHVCGLFDIRWGNGDPIMVFGPDDEEGCADLFSNPGILDFSIKARPFSGLRFPGELLVVPVPLIHSRTALGYAFEHRGVRMAYLCDTCGLSEESEKFLLNWRPHHLIIDCTWPPEQFPSNHNDIAMVEEIVALLQPDSTWITHIGHDLDQWLINNRLPEHIHLAVEGETIDLAGAEM